MLRTSKNRFSPLSKENLALLSALNQCKPVTVNERFYCKGLFITSESENDQRTSEEVQRINDKLQRKFSFSLPHGVIGPLAYSDKTLTGLGPI